MITVWQGSANTWDCDEMGHMNVRVYVEKAMEGLGVLAAAMGLENAFRDGATSTLIPLDQHIRYMREALPGRPLTMRAGLLEVGETDAVVYQEMRHGDGRVAAAFRTRVRHAVARTGRPFPWPSRCLDRVEALRVTAPEETAPRSLDPDGPVLNAGDATRAAADAAGVPLVGIGQVLPNQVDVHGRFWAPWFIGRISDSVPNLLYDWRSRIGEMTGGVDTGGAVLEYRLVYRAWPKVGDLLEVRSGLNRVGEKFHTLVHWVVDPVSGQPWLTSEAVAVTFDLKTRKIIPTPSDQIAALESIAPRGLSI